MQTVEIPALGMRTSRIGLGCASLVGRATRRQSSRMVETALDLGIRYFDVAPLYGMGTAEEVIGEVIGDSPGVVVATKVGLPRPAYSPIANMARAMAAPMSGRVRALRRMIRAIRTPRTTGPAAAAAQKDFSSPAIRASLGHSLDLLRRRRADVFLLHEPQPSDLNAEVMGTMDQLVAEGMVGTYGAGVDVVCEPPLAFGRIWQSPWPDRSEFKEPRGIQPIFHGVIRRAPRDPSGRLIEPARLLIERALDARPGCIILVAASHPNQLRSLLS
jgi:aryl-alcohol dehydrogenase-like predicted oxidoreductase